MNLPGLYSSPSDFAYHPSGIDITCCLINLKSHGRERCRRGPSQNGAIELIVYPTMAGTDKFLFLWGPFWGSHWALEMGTYAIESNKPVGYELIPSL
jgi:hypothetical protein